MSSLNILTGQAKASSRGGVKDNRSFWSLIWTVCGLWIWAGGLQLLSAQDVAPPTRMPTIRMNSETQIRKLPVPVSQLLGISTKLGLMHRNSPKIQITSDTRTGHLIVMAPASVQPKIAMEVRQLLAAASSDPSAAGSLAPFTHQLRNVNWQIAEQQFSRWTGSTPAITQNRQGQQAEFRLTSPLMMGTTLTVDRRRNRITVDAGAGKVEAWKRVLAVIDSPAQPKHEITTMIRLQNAEPAPIQRAIRLLTAMENRRALKGRSRSSRGTRVRPTAFQPPPPNLPGAGVVTPEAADRQPNINEQTGENGDGGAGVIGDTQIEFVPELGTIIIKGAKRDVQRVMDVIKQIEKQSEITKPDVEVVQLQHANSNAVADLLKQLYEDVLSARQGTVSITSLDAPNALLLIGRSEAIKSLLELIQKIDQPIDQTNGLRVFRLQNASALDAEQTIREFFTDRPGSGDEARPGLGNRIRILADYRTNSLIISASPRDMKEASRLIDELDVQQISAQSQIKVFSLRNALAEDLAPVIQEAIDGGGDGNDNQTVPNSALSIVDLDSGAGQILQSGILSGVVVTADNGANSIVVRGPANSMPLISELIRQLDRAPGIDSLVKVFTIENGDALQLAGALQDLFGDDASTTGTSVGAGNLAGLPSTTGAAESSLVPLRFSTDQRTNSIVASGSAEDLEVVESILLRLDSAGFAERITEVIWLRHQTAGDIAIALQEYVQQRTQTVNTIQQFQQGLGPFDLPDRDLIVIPEGVTNSLLLSVSPRLYEDVRRLIDRLDRRPPMVMVKVVLAEVSLDDTFEVGGEVGLQDSLIFDRGIAAGAINGATPQSLPGFGFNSNGTPNVSSFGQESLAGRGISTFGVGTTNPTIGYGGLVLSAASESLSVLFRTLQDANRLQVLSRPHIMTLDNIEAAVQVGRQVARIRDVTQNVQGTLVSTEDIQVGLILRIRPRVGSNGLIIMNVDTERSARDLASGTPIPAGDGSTVIIDDIITTNAQSTVAAFSGQTVVFGGLIQKTRSNFSRRVPVIADIPLLGNMFKYDQEVEIRSELLIFLTPTLVTGEEDLDYVKQVESSRMSWCLADVVEMHGDVGLSGGYGLWGPAVGQTIYPDMQPTIDDIIIHDDYSVERTSSTMNQSVLAPNAEVIPGSISYEKILPTIAPPVAAPPVQQPTSTPSLDSPVEDFQGELPGPAFPNGMLPGKIDHTGQKPITPTTQVSWDELIQQSELAR